MDYESKLKRLNLLIDLYRELSSDIKTKSLSMYADEVHGVYPVRNECLSIFSDLDGIQRDMEMQKFEGINICPE